MSLSPTEASRVIEKFVKSKCKVPINLIGEMGIGKSYIVQSAADRLGWYVIDIRLALDTEEDVAGWPRPTEDSVKYLINDWLKLATEKAKSHKGVIVFFDEINRSQQPVRQALFEVMSKYSVRRYQLPENTLLVFAMNPDDGDYQVEPLDPAFKRRMINIYVEPDHKGWGEWAKEHEHKDVLSFINNNPKYLFMGKEVKVAPVIPNPDAWRMVGDVMRKLGDTLTDKESLNVYAGIVGKEAATTFIKYLKSSLHPLTGEEVFGWEWEQIKDRLSDYASRKDNASLVTSGENVIDYMVANEKKLKTEHMERFCRFVLEYSPEIGIGVFTKLGESEGLITKLKEFKKSGDVGKDLIGKVVAKYERVQVEEEKVEAKTKKEA